MKQPSRLNQAVAEVVAAELERRRIGKTTLAPQLHVSPQTMLNLLDHGAPWKVAYLERLAESLNWSVTGIIDRADPTGELSRFDGSVRPRTQDEFDHAADESDDEDVERDKRNE